MHDEHPAVTSGEEVIVRGERWTVLRSTAYADCTSVRLNGIDSSNAASQRTVLLPFDTLERRQDDRPVRAAGARQWCRTVRRCLWQQRPFGGLDALASTRMELHPYQLEPALALHRHGCLRILIADAVGLGKTIQAAAALARLTHDEPSVRSLVVCPAGLRIQWRTELAERFGIDAAICDLEWLGVARRELPPGVNPWSLPGVFIASMDLVKRPEVRRDLEALDWDLAVFDEAHGLSPGTARLAAARVIADRSRRVLMLTATPPDGDADHLAALTSLGQASAADPVLVFRRTRTDVGLGGPRRSTLLPLRLSPEERTMHRLLDAYTAAVWREAGGRGEPSGRLLSILLRKRALSSAGSLAASVARRLLLLAADADVHPPAQLRLPLCDDEVEDAAETDPSLAARGLADVHGERRMLTAIHEAAMEASAAETKVRVLLRLLRRLREPAIVFTEYRDTLATLASALPEPPLQLHGGMLPQEREEVQSRFVREGGVLLATDAASEGLNLHHRCRTVVHFELPWNPMRLEQRIGRVDRLGQRRRVHELLLVARHTAERLVLTPLVRRVRAAQAARSEHPFTRLPESEVSAAILEERPLPPGASAPPRAPAAGFLAEGRIEAARLVRTRASGRPGRGIRGEPVVHWHRTERPLVLVVLRASGETAAGRQLGSALVPLHVDLLALGAGSVSLRSPESVEGFVSRWMPQLSAAAEDWIAAAPPWTGWQTLLASLMRREREIRSLGPATASHPLQTGLFDRRSQADAEAQRRAATAWRELADARLASLAREARPRIRLDVVAVCSGGLDV